MTTLNAKANTAYHELIAKTERENPGDVWAGFEHERDAFEAGHEAAQPAADREALGKAIEQAASDVDLAKYFLPGTTDRFVDAVLALLNETEKPVERWWITDAPLNKGGQKICGPFPSRDAALAGRAPLETYMRPKTFWVDEDTDGTAS